VFCRLVVIGRCILIGFDRYILCFCDHYVRLCVVFFTTPLHTVKCTLIAKTSVFTKEDDRCGNSSTQSQVPEDGYINIKLVFHSSTIAMMHGPINIRLNRNHSTAR